MSNSSSDSRVSVSLYAVTDVGMHRSGNEDSFLVADLTSGQLGLDASTTVHQVGDRGSLMVVSDGMGGAVAGEIASELAVTTLQESLMEMPFDLAITQRLKLAVEIANERIWNHAQQNPELMGMGATLTAVIAHQNMAYVGQVGDSRAYLIRAGQIKQITRDQSLVQLLIDSGAIKPEQAATVPQNVIMQALGTQPNVKVVMSAVRLCRDDSLLICSDGLSNKVGSDELRQMVSDAGDLTAACRSLIDLANQRGGEDNITVVIARFDGETLPQANECGSITGSLVQMPAEPLSELEVAVTKELASEQSSGGETTTLVMKAVDVEAAADEAQEPRDERLTAPMAAIPAPAAEPPAEEPVDLSEETTLRPEKADDAESEDSAAAPAPEMEQQAGVIQQAVDGELIGAGVSAAAAQGTRPTKKTSLVLIALISLASLAIAAYLFYRYYLAPRANKPAVEQQVAPAAEGEKPAEDVLKEEGNREKQGEDRPSSDNPSPPEANPGQGGAEKQPDKPPNPGS